MIGQSFMIYMGRQKRNFGKTETELWEDRNGTFRKTETALLGEIINILLKTSLQNHLL
jgi:hypothetical protein